MKIRHIFFTFFCFLTLMCCQISPSPIEYGTDGCHYCQMTIVDKLHAAQIVNQKGKAFKFDAIECMIRFSQTIDSTSIALHLCNNYTEPGQLIDAKKATFLISKNIPSPMGAYLSAFQSEREARKTQKENEGILFTWETLLNHLNKD